MNFFETTIANLSPSWGASRAKSRNVIKAFEAAKPSRTHKANREKNSANQAVFAAGQSLREQARWLDNNHDISIGILDKLEERVVGPKGIMIEPQPRNKGGAINVKFAELISERFKNWSLKPETTGRFARSSMERLVLRSWLRDGEIFAQVLRGHVPGYKYLTNTKFAIELLEADFVPMFNEVKNGVRQGIQTNAWGRATGYHVLYDHPSESFYSSKSKVIPAERMLHLALIKRVHQLRGVSLFHGVITRFSDLKEYEESERVAARIAAALGMYIKKGSPDLYEAKTGEEDKRQFDLGVGSVWDTLEPGEDVGMIESNRPSAAVVPWRSGQLRAGSAGMRSSYSSIARDYNGTFSSQRQELVEAHIGFQVLQDEFVNQWSRPVYRGWLEMELLNGIKVPTELDKDTLFDGLYLGPTMPWIDPKKEADAMETLKENKVASRSEWIRNRGENPREVMRQIDAEDKEYPQPDKAPKDKDKPDETEPPVDSNTSQS
ncbi:phage portal protein [Psychromonas sp. psych-6C06]|uniref:phage portal protein n=1 Tax=Psychromonas sp. psych-6C06 TaxID=2058089 RepID=UPI000C33EFF3|nr:phage portal protein [Psychromonas sp. psych-6C06]PKF60622.1 phage portal protein [Psychromonas sp. psych-6C06]